MGTNRQLRATRRFHPGPARRTPVQKIKMGEAALKKSKIKLKAAQKVLRNEGTLAQYEKVRRECIEVQLEFIKERFSLKISIEEMYARVQLAAQYEMMLFGTRSKARAYPAHASRKQKCLVGNVQHGDSVCVTNSDFKFYIAGPNGEDFSGEDLTVLLPKSRKLSVSTPKDSRAFVEKWDSTLELGDVKESYISLDMQDSVTDMNHRGLSSAPEKLQLGKEHDDFLLAYLTARRSFDRVSTYSSVYFLDSIKKNKVLTLADTAWFTSVPSKLMCKKVLKLIDSKEESKDLKSLQHLIKLYVYGIISPVKVKRKFDSKKMEVNSSALFKLNAEGKGYLTMLKMISLGRAFNKK